jgi:ribonuclease D
MTDLAQIWVDKPDELAACCEHLTTQRVIGFDTEFIGEATYHPNLCLIQVAAPNRLYAIDPQSVGPLDRFWGLVADPRRTVVVHAGREEIRICQQACGKAPAGIFDLQIAAGLVGIGYPLGYAALVQQVLQIPLAKGETLSDWSRRPLTSQQLEYAFNDVRYLLPLYEAVGSRLAELRRQEWMAEETADLVRHALFDGPEFERWRKLRGIGALDRKRLAVVRELFTWRETVAERQNRPARTVLRDDLLVEIARRMPKGERDLVLLRGVPAREHAAIVSAVRRARESSPENWPLATERDFDPPPVALVAGLLTAVLADVCARWSLIPGLVATNSDVKRVVRARFDGNAEVLRDSSFCDGWRARYVLPVLDSVLDGRRSIRIGDLHQAMPLVWDSDGPPPAP